MHALISNNTVKQYPYTIGNLRRDNPNTSFPKRPSDELLSDWGLQRVAKIDRPNVNHTKNVNEGTPVLSGDVWTQVWVVSDATADEVAERTKEKSASIRTKRDGLLAETDWMALSDVTMSAEMTTHRQALRDITDHENFPHLTDEDWPVKP